MPKMKGMRIANRGANFADRLEKADATRMPKAISPKGSMKLAGTTGPMKNMPMAAAEKEKNSQAMTRLKKLLLLINSLLIDDNCLFCCKF